MVGRLTLMGASTKTRCLRAAGNKHNAKPHESPWMCFFLGGRGGGCTSTLLNRWYLLKLPHLDVYIIDLWSCIYAMHGVRWNHEQKTHSRIQVEVRVRILSTVASRTISPASFIVMKDEGPEDSGIVWKQQVSNSEGTVGRSKLFARDCVKGSSRITILVISVHFCLPLQAWGWWVGFPKPKR